MVVRTVAELKIMVEEILAAYPDIEDTAIGYNPLRAYCAGILAGLKTALGEYPSFAEINLTEWIESTFNRGEAV